MDRQAIRDMNTPDLEAFIRRTTSVLLEARMEMSRRMDDIPDAKEVNFEKYVDGGTGFGAETV